MDFVELDEEDILKKIGPCQYPTPDYNAKFIKEIIEAIGDKKGISEEAKVLFAGNIYAELEHMFCYAKDLKNMPVIQKNLLKSSSKAKHALEEFWKDILKSREELKSITPLANGFLSEELNCGCTIKEIIIELSAYNNNLSEVNIRKSGPGPNNTTSLQIATMVAKLYKRFLGTKPSPGSGELYFSPYDRICSVIEKNLPIKFSTPTKKKAVKNMD